MAGIETTDSSFPPFCFRVSATSRLKCHARYKLAAVPLETRGPNTDCIATTRLVLILGTSLCFYLFYSFELTRGLSLRLSVSRPF